MRAAARYLLLAALVASPARAGDVELARKTFAEGVKLFQRGDYEGARRLFRDADREHHAPAIVYNLALAEEKLGHAQAAVDAYEAYVAEVGDQGELSSAAAVAIAQLRARSTRLRIETKPPGARLFVDGTALREPSPTSYLVPAGHHLVFAQGDGWTKEEEIEARGTGDTMQVILDGPAEPPKPAPQPLPVEPTPDPPKPVPAKPEMPAEPPAEPDAIVWGAQFAIVPCFLLPVTERTPEQIAAGDNPLNTASGLSILAGANGELGWALTERFEFFARGFIGIGPDAKPSYGYWLGPAISYRVGTSAWLGASFIGGEIATRLRGVPYGTDQVFGMTLEAMFSILKKPHGEWLIGLQPGFLLTHMQNDNTTFFFPVMFGYRAY